MLKTNDVEDTYIKIHKDDVISTMSYLQENSSKHQHATGDHIAHMLDWVEYYCDYYFYMNVESIRKKEPFHGNASPPYHCTVISLREYISLFTPSSAVRLRRRLKNE